MDRTLDISTSGKTVLLATIALVENVDAKAEHHLSPQEIVAHTVSLLGSFGVIPPSLEEAANLMLTESED